MTKIIPHSNVLVVMVGPSGAGKSTFISNHFDEREVVSSDALRIELVGDMRRQDKNDLVWKEFHRRIEAKLQMGGRVIADATHLKRADRMRVVEIAKLLDKKVVYVVINRSVVGKMQTAGWREGVMVGEKSLIQKHEDTFVANEKQILSGDNGNADVVIDTRKDEFTVAHQITRDPKQVLNQIASLGYSKVRVVGDVHGNLTGLNKALDTKDTFFLFLGDVVDYGVNTLITTKMVADMVFDGRAVCIRGNHEKKINNIIEKSRTAKGFNGKVTHGNEVTTNQLAAMNTTDRDAWENMFLSFVEATVDHVVIEDAMNSKFMFVHAAAHPKLWENDMRRLHRNSKEESFALYGESRGNTDAFGFPERLMNWVDMVPARHHVTVGHAILSVDAPVHFKSNLGGSVVFMDTGSSKSDNVTGRDGHLSWVDYHLETHKKGLLFVRGAEGRE